MLKKIYYLLEPADRKKCAGLAVVVLLTSVLNFAGLAAVFPLLKRVLDKNSGGGDTPWLLLAVVVFIILKNLAVMGLNRIQTNFLLRQYRHFSYQLFCRYYQRGLLFIRGRGAVQLANDVNSLCLTFSTSVLQSILVMVGEGILVVMVTSALFVLSPVAALFLLVVCMPLVGFYILVVRPRARRYGTADYLAHRKQARLVVETFRGYAELEINNAFENQLDNFSGGIDTVNSCRRKMNMIREIPSLLSEVAIILGLVMLVMVRGTDHLLVGGAFAMAAFRLMPSLRTILGGWTSLQQASHSVDMLYTEMNTPEREVPAREPLTFNRCLKAQDVTFAYPDGQTVLQHFSCSIAKGECVGVQGASGAGKSTLFNILLGFFPPQQGRVMVDDRELTAANVKSWHALVGYVPQDIFILKSSLAENVAFGEKTIDRERVLQVLEQVQLKPWLETLSNGLDTQLGEAGSRLSGGQKQRIGIARALYKRASVLFFDEATSALDNATEQEINHTLKTLSQTQQELTMVIIAHRTASLAFCNRIINVSPDSNT
ncbi:MAG: ABC transporter ATP-binding protein/permease [Paludibacteraceae bacterium]|nr:ABC transporter ATP-binding protein/permease [Paludibacteraceae bacterium]